jgi:SAM-dependent methyltransferase
MTLRARAGSRAPLLRGLSYFEYQRLVGRDVVIPWVTRRLKLDGLYIGDYGAHQGGMLEALRQLGTVQGAVGLELSEDIVASSPFVADEQFILQSGDLLDVSPGRPFDLILLHDVLEHIPDRDAPLEAVRSSLAPTGHIFVSFPPYNSPFGGHQQLARGAARMIPFIHFLPSRLFFRTAQPGANEYMSADASLQDMVSVRQTKLTLREAEHAFARAGFEVVDQEFFLVRPEYTIRYGLRQRTAGAIGRLPGIREFLVNGAFYLLRRGQDSNG